MTATTKKASRSLIELKPAVNTTMTSFTSIQLFSDSGHLYLVDYKRKSCTCPHHLHRHPENISDMCIHFKSLDYQIKQDRLRNVAHKILIDGGYTCEQVLKVTKIANKNVYSVSYLTGKGKASLFISGKILNLSSTDKFFEVGEIKDKLVKVKSSNNVDLILQFTSKGYTPYSENTLEISPDYGFIYEASCTALRKNIIPETTKELPVSFEYLLNLLKHTEGTEKKVSLKVDFAQEKIQILGATGKAIGYIVLRNDFALGKRVYAFYERNNLLGHGMTLEGNKELRELTVKLVKIADKY